MVDKTGTLTEGKPKVTAIVSLASRSEADLLRLAAALERSSEHPLAAAIVAAAEERGIAVGTPANFRSITGKGVVGTVEGAEVALGNRALMEELGDRCRRGGGARRRAAARGCDGDVRRDRRDGWPA